ncbi:MAG: FAD binding domain-containing protein [Immundisolibacterales bacterium]|nr:FAD binding domain-containing protein [Immundisolibacterales bacterium]
MKAASFAYTPARSTAHALELLAERPGSRPVAGGQSLGPMLNLRLARPARLVDIRRCPDLRRYEESNDAVVYGAGITHAEIEDGTVPDPSPGWLRHAARNIAYRAIRNRGTIGGSLAHADPAADWPVVLAALGAEVWIDGPDGRRAVPLPSFFHGPFTTSLTPGELVTAVRVPRPTERARFGYSKLAAKSGEFALALAVVFEDPERGTRRAAIGAIERAPLVIDIESPLSGAIPEASALLANHLPAETGGPLHAAALARAARSVRTRDSAGTRPDSFRAVPAAAGAETGSGYGSGRGEGEGSGMAMRQRRGSSDPEPDPDPVPTAADALPPKVHLTVNGRPVESDVQPRTHLADFLRERLHLTGTHLGCEHGVCGACTVLIDGVPARSCIAFAAACDGSDIRTIEGFAEDRVMNALRTAFSDRHALQCGYCTPGMLVTAWDLVRRISDADEPRVRKELAGNLCRCTGYQGIVEAIGDVLAGAAGADASRVPAPAMPVPAMLDRPRAASGARPSLRPATAAGSNRDGAEIAWRAAIPADPEKLWGILRDVPRMVEAMPGTALAGAPDEMPLRLRLTVAIGPMRPSFDGEAHVSWDDDTRSGSVDGRADDAASRSSANGRVRFRVVEDPDEPGSATLELAIRYRIRGPLAQFSRGPVVDAVMEQLLARFATNLDAAAAGRAISQAPPPGGLRLLLAAAAATVRRWLAG